MVWCTHLPGWCTHPWFDALTSQVDALTSQVDALTPWFDALTSQVDALTHGLMHSPPRLMHSPHGLMHSPAILHIADQQLPVSSTGVYIVPELAACPGRCGGSCYHGPSMCRWSSQPTHTWEQNVEWDQSGRETQVCRHESVLYCHTLDNKASMHFVWKHKTEATCWVSSHRFVVQSWLTCEQGTTRRTSHVVLWVLTWQGRWEKGTCTESSPSSTNGPFP